MKTLPLLVTVPLLKILEYGRFNFLSQVGITWAFLEIFEQVGKD